jgi:hypothetical protein
MKVGFFAVLAFGALIGSSCAKRIPEPTGVPPGTPHITWVLMYGDRNNADDEFACQSEPKTECVIPASGPDAQSFADVHFYFHGAGNETKYEGTTSIGFLQGRPEAHTSRTNITVKKNESITNSSTTGIVTSIPGMYTVALDFNATVTDTSKRQPVRESFQVRVQ